MKWRLTGQALALLVLAFLPAVGQVVYLRDRTSWNAPVAAGDEVTVERAARWGDAALWVDARADEQFEKAHVPGAVQLNEDRWNELLPQLLAKWSPEKRLIVYCSSEACGASREVARRLREEARLKNVLVLEGGWEAWLATKK